MPIVRCPICNRRFDTDKSRALPFCSQHCQYADLGRWLNEDYGIPVEPEGDDFEQESSQNGEE